MLATLLEKVPWKSAGKAVAKNGDMLYPYDPKQVDVLVAVLPE